MDDDGEQPKKGKEVERNQIKTAQPPEKPATMSTLGNSDWFELHNTRLYDNQHDRLTIKGHTLGVVPWEWFKMC